MWISFNGSVFLKSIRLCSVFLPANHFFEVWNQFIIFSLDRIQSDVVVIARNIVANKKCISWFFVFWENYWDNFSKFRADRGKWEFFEPEVMGYLLIQLWLSRNHAREPKYVLEIRFHWTGKWGFQIWDLFIYFFLVLSISLRMPSFLCVQKLFLLPHSS